MLQIDAHPFANSRNLDCAPRLLLEQSYFDLHCLPRPNCLKSYENYRTVLFRHLNDCCYHSKNNINLGVIMLQIDADPFANSEDPDEAALKGLS